jgi:hypothetical protein
MVKTPSVLKWMINRRAKLLGEIKKAEKRFDSRVLEIQQELDMIENLRLFLEIVWNERKNYVRKLWLRYDTTSPLSIMR